MIIHICINEYFPASFSDAVVKVYMIALFNSVRANASVFIDTWQRFLKSVKRCSSKCIQNWKQTFILGNDTMIDGCFLVQFFTIPSIFLSQHNFFPAVELNYIFDPKRPCVVVAPLSVCSQDVPIQIFVQSKRRVKTFWKLPRQDSISIEHESESKRSNFVNFCSLFPEHPSCMSESIGPNFLSDIVFQDAVVVQFLLGGENFSGPIARIVFIEYDG